MFCKLFADLTINYTSADIITLIYCLENRLVTLKFRIPRKTSLSKRSTTTHLGAPYHHYLPHISRLRIKGNNLLPPGILRSVVSVRQNTFLHCVYCVMSRTHVHSGTVGVNHSVQNHKLYSDRLAMHTCGENYEAIYDCVIRNKAKGITGENRNQERQKRRSICAIVTHV